MTEAEPIKPEEYHPAYMAYEMALKAWADAVNADKGLLAMQRLGNPAAATKAVEETNRAARAAYRAWRLAGFPLYVIPKKTPTA